METLKILEELIKETLPTDEINWEMQGIESLFEKTMIQNR